jgi:hypothetical protein
MIYYLLTWVNMGFWLNTVCPEHLVQATACSIDETRRRGKREAPAEAAGSYRKVRGGGAARRHAQRGRGACQLLQRLRHRALQHATLPTHVHGFMLSYD